MSVAHECRRQALVFSLRKKLKTLVGKKGKVPPVMAFERYITNVRRLLTKKQALKDPILPYYHGIEDGLLKDLVRVGLSEGDAKEIIVSLGKESMRLIDGLIALKEARSKCDGGHRARVVRVYKNKRMKREEEMTTGSSSEEASKKKDEEDEDGEDHDDDDDDEEKDDKSYLEKLEDPKNDPEVVITYHQHTVSYTYGSHRHVIVTTQHYEKMQHLFRIHSTRWKVEVYEDSFDLALFCLLLRYKSLLGHGRLKYIETISVCLYVSYISLHRTSSVSVSLVYISQSCHQASKLRYLPTA